MSTGPDYSLALGGEELLAFGPFLLNRARRVLLRDGEPVRVGAHAMETLIALTERPGVTLSKRELLGRVWPDSTTVQESTLRVYISQLRKIFRDGETGVEYVQNVMGRGYRFIALTTRRETPARAASRGPHSSIGTALSVTVQQPARMNDLPVLLAPVFGLAPAIRTLAARLPKQRFVTITGPGGGGKTTLALSVAVALASAYPQGICFVDLASVTEPRLVPGALASALGVAALSRPLPKILSFLSKKSVLLVLDNCEHVIEAAAQLAASVLSGAHDVHILATSREPLQVVGESIYRLPPLEAPPAKLQAPRETLLNFPAIRLFTEWAARYSDSKLDDAKLLLVADICRQLGGNPLAIEITAAYASLMGVRALAARLRDDHYLSINGLRTTVSRHRTLRATLDWSYDLLSPSQQLTFRRLSVFVGSFDLKCAVAVVAEENRTVSEVFKCLTDLTRKSLVIAETAGQKVLYRLLDLPRAFAREKLGLSGELAMIKRRHAQMWCTVGAAEIQARIRQGAEWMSGFGQRLEDLRAAMFWCSSPGSDSSAGTKLTLLSLWSELVLAAESAGHVPWSQLSACIPRASQCGAFSELESILTDIRLRVEAPMSSQTVAQQIADGEPDKKIALWSLWVERVVNRDYRIAINISEAAHGRVARWRALAAPLIDRMLAVVHHYAGSQPLACRHAEWALDSASDAAAPGAVEALQRCHTRTILARALWLRGLADQARDASRRSVSEAQLSGNRRLHCITLLWAVGVAIWRGDKPESRRLLAVLSELSNADSCACTQVWVDCLGRICMDPADGLQATEPLRLSADPLTGSQYTDVMGSLSEDLVSTDAIVRAENGRGGWCTSEILRVKAERMLREEGLKAAPSAAAVLQTALETARQQGALSWELRTAMSLARLWRDQQEPRAAHDLLAAVYGRFTEGFATADLAAARRLLQELAAALGGSTDVTE